MHLTAASWCWDMGSYWLLDHVSEVSPLALTCGAPSQKQTSLYHMFIALVSYEQTLTNSCS